MTFDERKKRARETVSIAAVWRAAGLPSPPAPGRNVVVRSPFRADDKNPSFSIYDGGKRFADKARPDVKGDVFSFASLSFNLSIAEAMRRVFVMAGDTEPMHRRTPRLEGITRRPPRDAGDRQAGAPPAAPEVSPGTAPPPEEEAPYPLLEDPRMPTPEEIRAITASRSLTEAAGRVLASRGHLIPAEDDDGDFTFWAICDSPGWLPPEYDPIFDQLAPQFPARAAVMEARRLDRQPFPHGAKAHTMKGSVKTWPIGISALAWPGNDRTMILAVEGGPDLLAAHDLIEGLRVAHEFVPVALLSREITRLHPEAAALIRGRHVHIIPHVDPDTESRCFRMGAATAERWAASLFAPAGAARVTCATLRGLTRPDGQPAKDLCEALEDGGHWRHYDGRRSGLWDLLPHHARAFRCL